MTVVDDEELDEQPCYRHPSRMTALHCIECERPICVDCAVNAPVGIKCPDCARTSRAARGVVPAHRLLFGSIAAIVVSLVLGVILTVAHVPFFGLFIAYFGGAGIGEVARRASGGYRDPMLARVAAGAAFFGMVLLPLAGVLLRDDSALNLVRPAVFGAAAAVGAYQRAS